MLEIVIRNFKKSIIVLLFYTALSHIFNLSILIPLGYYTYYIINKGILLTIALSYYVIWFWTSRDKILLLQTCIPSLKIMKQLSIANSAVLLLLGIQLAVARNFKFKFFDNFTLEDRITQSFSNSSGVNRIGIRDRNSSSSRNCVYLNVWMYS